MFIKRVAIYYRVSTDKQDFAMQQHVVNKWVAENKPEQIFVFEDHAKSGRNVQRPGFQKMLKKMYRRSFDAIVVYSLDRLSRSMQDAVMFFLKLNNCRVDLISITQPFLTTADNPFRGTMFMMMSELAQVETQIFARRVKNGLDAAKARGVKLGPPLKVTEEKREEILRLRKLKKTYREICEVTELSIGSVWKVLRC